MCRYLSICIEDLLFNKLLIFLMFYHILDTVWRSTMFIHWEKYFHFWFLLKSDSRKCVSLIRFVPLNSVIIFVYFVHYTFFSESTRNHAKSQEAVVARWTKSSQTLVRDKSNIKMKKCPKEVSRFLYIANMCT